MAFAELNPLIHATSAGLIEAEISGSGTPILVLHGSPGGIDAARSMSRFLDRNTFRVICLSRPGYLNTPLSPTMHSIDDEADLLASLLDAWQIPKTGVLTWSGGGPAAYQLAARHPDRVSSIVSIAALSSAYNAPKTHISERLLLGTKLGHSLLKFASTHWPEHIITSVLEGEGSLRGEDLNSLAEQVAADPDQRQLVLEMALTVNLACGRKDGWTNDITNFAAISSLDLEHVQCPVLLVHGELDTDVVPSHSKTAHARLPLSSILIMPQGTHLSFYAHSQARDIQKQAKTWFLNHT